MTAGQSFVDLPALAAHLRQELENKKTILLYAYNGTGKMRLSMAFKDIGKQGPGDEEARDTLYFNAFSLRGGASMTQLILHQGRPCYG